MVFADFFAALQWNLHVSSSRLRQIFRECHPTIHPHPSPSTHPHPDSHPFHPHPSHALSVRLLNAACMHVSACAAAMVHSNILMHSIRGFLHNLSHSLRVVSPDDTQSRSIHEKLSYFISWQDDSYFSLFFFSFLKRDSCLMLDLSISGRRLCVTQWCVIVKSIV